MSCPYAVVPSQWARLAPSLGGNASERGAYGASHAGDAAISRKTLSITRRASALRLWRTARHPSCAAATRVRDADAATGLGGAGGTGAVAPPAGTGTLVAISPPPVSAGRRPRSPGRRR